MREDFYELSSSYSDGLAPRSAFERLPEHPPIQLGNIKNLPELGQMKYLALLRYLESTVMEVDVDSGVYHLVHQQSEDFLDLRSGNTFAESLHAFAEHAVHPDDRPLVLEILDKYIEDFFSSGLMKRSRKYRIFHPVSYTQLDVYKRQTLRILRTGYPISPRRRAFPSSATPR